MVLLFPRFTFLKKLSTESNQVFLLINLHFLMVYITPRLTFLKKLSTQNNQTFFLINLHFLMVYITLPSYFS